MIPTMWYNSQDKRDIIVTNDGNVTIQRIKPRNISKDISFSGILGKEKDKIVQINSWNLINFPIPQQQNIIVSISQTMIFEWKVTSIFYTVSRIKLLMISLLVMNVLTLSLPFL